MVYLYGAVFAMSDDTLKAFKNAVLVRNVIARAFPSDDALKKYLRDHPNADKSKHHVEDADVARIKKNVKDWKKVEKGQADAEKKREKRKDEKGKKKDEADAKALKDRLKKHQEDFPEGSMKDPDRKK